MRSMQAIAAAIEERVPGASNQGFAVIALGQAWRARAQLFVGYRPDSSCSTPNTLPHRERDDVAEAAVRYGRRVD